MSRESITTCCHTVKERDDLKTSELFVYVAAIEVNNDDTCALLTVHLCKSRTCQNNVVFCVCLLLGIVSYNAVFVTCLVDGHERKCVRLHSRSMRCSHDGSILPSSLSVDVVGFTTRPAANVDVFVLFVMFHAATV